VLGDNGDGNLMGDLSCCGHTSSLGLKGWTATNKRTREASPKLSIQFSRLGGPVGSNK